MLSATRDTRPATSLLLFIAVGLLLGLIPYSYHALELLVCWLFFSLVYVSLALVLLGGVLAFYAGKSVIRWASNIPRLAPTVSLGPAELHLKTTSGVGESK